MDRLTKKQMKEKLEEMKEQAESSIEYSKSIGVKSYPYDIGYYDCINDLIRWIEE